MYRLLDDLNDFEERNKRVSDSAIRLHRAADNGSPDDIRAIIGSGVDVDARDGLKMTPLMSAACNEKLENMAALLEAGADVGARDFSGSTVLHLTCKNKGMDCTIALVAAGADTEAEDVVGHKPLHMASIYGTKELLEYYISRSETLEESGSHGRTPLLLAAANGKLHNLETLINHGADIDSKDETGCNLLHQAAENENSDVFHHVLNMGFPIDSRGFSGETPLFCAAVEDLTENAKVLLNAGADIHARKDDGETVLHAAGLGAGEEMIKILAVSKSLLNQGDIKGRTALHVASYEGNLESAKALMDVGADMNSRDAKGYTPISLAALCNRIELVKLLFDAGANTCIAANDGTDLISLAKRAKEENMGDESLKFLMEKGVGDYTKPMSARIATDSHSEVMESRAVLNADDPVNNELPEWEIPGFADWARPLVRSSTPVKLSELIEKLGYSTPSVSSLSIEDWQSITGKAADMGFGIAPYMGIFRYAPSINISVLLYDSGINHNELDESSIFGIMVMKLAFGAHFFTFGRFNNREVGLALRKAAAAWDELDESDMPGIHANINYLLLNPPEPDYIDNTLKIDPKFTKLSMRVMVVEFMKATNAGKAKKLTAMESYYEYLELDPKLAHSDLQTGVPVDSLTAELGALEDYAT